MVEAGRGCSVGTARVRARKEPAKKYRERGQRGKEGLRGRTWRSSLGPVSATESGVLGNHGDLVTDGLGPCFHGQQ